MPNPEDVLLSLPEALARIRTDIVPLREPQRLPLKHGLGRVLASAIHAPFALPANTVSAMDGYAFNSADIPAGGDCSLKLAGVSWAGRPYSEALPDGQCVRIFTGAILPHRADTVVIQEQVIASENTIRFTTDSIRTGQYTRQAGGDIDRGQRLFAKGRQLDSIDLGVLAALGQVEIEVIRRPRVAFFATGDELKPLGTPLGPGEIYDSNRYTLHALLTRLGADTFDMGVLPDKKNLIKAALTEAAQHSDAIITTGGASVGEADLIRAAVIEIGQLDFCNIALKPGKPFAYGRIANSRFFGLPGNPVAVMVTFCELVRPALRQLMGTGSEPDLIFPVRCESVLRKSPGRMEFQRGILTRNEDGELCVRGTGDQSSHRLAAMSKANCFIILPSENCGVEIGDIVKIKPFHGLL